MLAKSAVQRPWLTPANSFVTTLLDPAEHAQLMIILKRSHVAAIVGELLHIY